MAEAARKPNLVSGTGYPIPADDHSSMDACCQASPATYPGAQAGRLQTLLYLVLHQVGFTKLLRSPEELVRSYRTISPLPGCFRFPRRARKATAGRYIFCCTFLRVAATPRYGAPCPVVFGLSSGSGSTRRSSVLLRPCMC